MEPRIGTNLPPPEVRRRGGSLPKMKISKSPYRTKRKLDEGPVVSRLRVGNSMPKALKPELDREEVTKRRTVIDKKP